MRASGILSYTIALYHSPLRISRGPDTPNAEIRLKFALRAIGTLFRCTCTPMRKNAFRAKYGRDPEKRAVNTP